MHTTKRLWIAFGTAMVMMLASAYVIVTRNNAAMNGAHSTPSGFMH